MIQETFIKLEVIGFLKYCYPEKSIKQLRKYLKEKVEYFIDEEKHQILIEDGLLQGQVFGWSDTQGIISLDNE